MSLPKWKPRVGLPVIPQKDSSHLLLQRHTPGGDLRTRRGCWEWDRIMCLSPSAQTWEAPPGETVEAEWDGPRNRSALFLAGWKLLSLLISLKGGCMA